MSKVPEIERGFKKEEYYGWRCSGNMVDQYLAGCLAASSYDSVFKKFKQQDSYGYILEHVPGALGGDYLLNVEKNNFDLLKDMQKFLINDLHGNPTKSTYILHKLKDIRLLMSPTTARYIKVLSDLKTLFGSLDNMNIVEIGTGYGGLPLIVSKEYDFKNYYDVDLYEPSQLALRYCKKAHSVKNFHVITPEQIDQLDDIEIDLVISNYAFSECNDETQDVYIDKILSKAKRGYITHNNSDERRERTKSIIQDYPNFKVFDHDLCKKKHPIFTWGADD
jgi:hypothetical protein